MEKKIDINIFGNKYTFITETESARAKKIGELLEEEVARIESREVQASGTANQNVVLISAALNIINRYYELKDRHSELIEILSKRNDRIKTILDKSIISL